MTEPADNTAAGAADNTAAGAADNTAASAADNTALWNNHADWWQQVKR